MAKRGQQQCLLQFSFAVSLAQAVYATATRESQLSGDILTPAMPTSFTSNLFAGRYGVAGMANAATVLSLGFMFIVGVSTGFLWKSFHKLSKTTAVSTSPPSLSPSSSHSHSHSPSTRRTTRALSVGSLKQFRQKEIVDMTENFKLELGRGGQGVVYFATLPDSHSKAAVKRLQKTLVVGNANENQRHSQEAMEKAFWAELKTISRLHHRNLVSLLGYCVEEDDLFLVYEYMGRGSLSQRLHPKEVEGEGESEGVAMDWNARMRCAVEVAQGLEYLHSHANPSLVHRDIKSGNILFDDEMNAKIADFGLSKAVEMDREATVTTRVRGTHGYVDPAYLQNGVPCDKNDVYSYGVVLLELITGRRAIDKKAGLVQWCKDSLGPDEHTMRTQLPRIVDSRMSPLDVSYDQIFQVVKVARSCVQERQDSRPSMQDVVAGLYNATANSNSNSNSMDLSDLSTSTEFPTVEVPLNRFGSNVGSSHDGSLHSAQSRNQRGDCSPSYDVKENTILVKCTVAGAKVVVRCKIWPTAKNFGLNKVEATLNGAFLWKKGLWWYNAKSSRDFTIGHDGVKLHAEWHVALRTNWDSLPLHDPRRSLGPFCVEYLALKDENHVALVEYHGDKSPMPPPPPPPSPLDKPPSQERRNPRRQSSGSGSGSGSVERRRSNNPARLGRSNSPL